MDSKLLQKFPSLSQIYLLFYFLESLFRNSVIKSQWGKWVNRDTPLYGLKLSMFLECSKIQRWLGKATIYVLHALMWLNINRNMSFSSVQFSFARIKILTSFVIRLRVSSGYCSMICSSLGNFSLASLECNFKAFNILSTKTTGYVCSSTDSITYKDRKKKTVVNISAYTYIINLTYDDIFTFWLIFYNMSLFSF